MKHIGSCHCGKVRYEAESDLVPLLRCNCSYCTRQGSILTFVPEENFTLLSGAEALTEYRFNTGRIQHLFCATCGVESFARGQQPDGTPMVALNVHCLEGIDRFDLAPKDFDGKTKM